MELLGDVSHVESRFGPFGNNVSMQDRCTVCAKHTIGSEIILDAPDGTPWSRGSSESSFWSIVEIVLILTQDICSV
jgi:hypothetical protein